MNAVGPDEIQPADAPSAPVSKASKAKPAPVCIMSGETLDPDRMLRFVIGPDDALFPDFAENLPGKAVWCNLYRQTMQQAVEADAFSKAFGQSVKIPENILETIEKGLRHQALSMVSMARKAGQLVTGAEKTEQVLRSGKAGVYLTAAAKDADTREKLSFLARKDVRIVDLFTSDELSQASGARKVFHAGMTRGGVAARFFVHVKRLNLFRKT